MKKWWRHTETFPSCLPYWGSKHAQKDSTHVSAPNARVNTCFDHQYGGQETRMQVPCTLFI